MVFGQLLVHKSNDLCSCVPTIGQIPYFNQVLHDLADSMCSDFIFDI